jgi:hypothetical protein
MLKPSGNGFYLLPYTSARVMLRPYVDPSIGIDVDVAFAAQCDHFLLHHRFGHMNMHSLHAHHVTVSHLRMRCLTMYILFHAIHAY